MKKSLILIFAFIFLSAAINIFAQDDTRVAAAWRVLKYDITATLPTSPADRYLAVRATLNMQNVGNGSGTRATLRLSEKAEVSSVMVNNTAGTFTKGEEKIGNRSLQRVIVNLPSVQPNGTTTVTVDYKLKIDENSGLNSISPAGSHFLPLSFWYPTPNNHYASKGADFAPFRLNVTAPAGETVVTTGKSASAGFDL